MMVRIWLHAAFVMVCLLALCGSSLAQQVDCELTRQAWLIDPRLSDYHNCYCPSAHAQPVCTKKSTVSPNAGGSSGASLQTQMLQSIFQSFFNNLFAPPPDTSVQDEIERQNAIKQQQTAEQAKKAVLEKWRLSQTQADLQRKMDQEDRIKRGGDLLSKTKTVGGGAKLEPFSFGNPKLDLEPLSQNTYPNTRLTTWDRLLCSAYFSNLAKQSTKDEDTRFYADQAQRVLIGEPTYLKCRMPQVSNEKLAKKMKEVKKVYDEMNVKIKDLQNIEYKISESKEKIKNAELKKEEATKKLDELQNRATTMKPEEKAEVDDLAAMAQKQLQDAEQEINQAKQSEKEALNKKEQLENELSQAQAKIQAGVE